MARPRLVPLLAAALLAAAAALAGCGGGGGQGRGPVLGKRGQESSAARELGFPGFATKNTTRVSGGDPTVDAAGVALAVYPSNGQGTHPQVVTLAPEDDWQAAIASAVLMSPPIKAPVLDRKSVV